MGDFRWNYLGNAVLFAALGLAMLALVLWGLDRATGFWRKIFEENNLAVAVWVGALTLGVAWILANAVH